MQGPDPYLLELEQSVLGGVLIQPAILSELGELEVADFRDLRAQACWVAMRALEASGRPIDAGTVMDELHRSGKLDAAGLDFVGLCALRVPVAANTVEYARRVRSYGLRRRLAASLDHLRQQALDTEQEPEDVIAAAHASLLDLGKGAAQSGRSIGEAVVARWAEIEAIARARADGMSAMSGYPTGVAKLDELLGGWQPGIVSIVGARPGMGKSALGLSTAMAVANAGHGVHVFSLEDSERSYSDRLLSRMCGVPSSALRQAKLGASEVASVAAAVAAVRRGRRWVIDEAGGLSVEQVVRRMRARKRELGTKVAILDYATLLTRQRGESGHDASTRTMQALQASAKADDVAWVLMCQLGRDVEKRVDKRPVKSDLRESGSFEELAKTVVLLYRGSVYGGEPKHGVDYFGDERCPTTKEWQSQIQLIVDKNSNGPSPETIVAHWDGPRTAIW